MKNTAKTHKTLIGSILAIIIFAFIPLFIKSPYYVDLFIVALVNAVLGIAFIMVLRTGLINMGLAAFWGLGAYASTILVMKLNLSFWLALPATILIIILVAIVIGYFLIGSGSTGFNFVILSSVIGMLFPVTVGSIKYLGAYQGISNIPPPDPISLPFLPEIAFTSKVPFFYLGLFLFLIIILVSKAFYHSWTGRAWSAIGLNPRLAESLGINLFKYKLLAFVIASAMVGIIGSFYAHYATFIIPNTYGMWVNVYIQIYAILGGVGYAILGPIFGATVMTFLPQFFGMTREVATILTGAMLIFLVLFLPSGLLGLIDMKAFGINNIRKFFTHRLPARFGGKKDELSG